MYLRKKLLGLAYKNLPSVVVFNIYHPRKLVYNCWLISNESELEYSVVLFIQIKDFSMKCFNVLPGLNQVITGWNMIQFYFIWSLKCITNCPKWCNTSIYSNWQIKLKLPSINLPKLSSLNFLYVSVAASPLFNLVTNNFTTKSSLLCSV